MQIRATWTFGAIAAAGLAATAAAGSEPDTVSIGDAAWHRTEWRASTFERSTQSQPAIAVDPDGGVLVVWSSRRQQDGKYGVYAQRFDADGVAIGVETPVNVWTDSHQWMPTAAIGAARDAAGDARTRAWAAWQSHGQDGDGGAIIARRLDLAGASGFAGGSEIAVNDDPRGHQSAPVVVASPTGGALVVWSTATTPDAPSRLRGRLFDARGLAVDAAFGTCESPEIVERTPGAAFAADGSFVISYAAVDADTHEPVGIRLQRFDATGHPLGAPLEVGDARWGHEVEPTLTATPDGFAMAWLAARRGPDGVAADWSVAMRRLAADGQPSGAPIIVSPATRGGHAGAAVAAAPDGRLVVAYNRDDGDETGIFARLFAPGATTPLGGEFRVNARVEGDQALRVGSGAAQIAFAPNGRVVCAWSGDAGRGDASAVNVTMLTPRAVDLAGRVQGVTDEMPPALHAAQGNALALAGPEAPQPHLPPTFDPRAVDASQREMTLAPGGIGFTAIVNTGWTPPDPHMAVGPSQILVMTNGAIASFAKDGAFQWQDEIESDFGFWGALGAGGFVFDPEVVYDPISERFFAMASDADFQGGPSYILIAVSTDSTPTELSWHKYRFNTGALAGGTYDSPNIAVDADTVYITGDALGQYPAYVYDKASLLAGLPPVATNSFLISTLTQSAGIPPVSFDDAPALYMAEHKEGATNTAVRLIALRDALTSPIVDNFTITVPAYGPPEDPPQMGTGSRPNTFDARFWSVAYRNGSLWATHHVNGDRVLARWYEFAMNGWPTSGDFPTLVQSGDIDLGGSIRTFFSSITVDDFGNAAICYARSSPNEFLSMATSYRYAGDPLGTFGPSVIHASADAGYTAGRWGDYSEIEVDPADGKTIWAHHEYAIGSSWRTWVQQTVPAFAAADINCDGAVDFQDLLRLLAAWGPCPGCPEDVDEDGDVDFQDLLQLLAQWTG